MDKKTVWRTVFLTLILLNLFLSLQVFAAPTLREYLNTGGDSNNSFRGASWLAQTFTTPSEISDSHTVTAVKLYLRKIGNDRPIIVGIRAVDGFGKPTGSDLTSSTVTTGLSGTLAWITFTMNTEITLMVNTQYAIVARCPTGDTPNQPYWNYDNANGYAGGQKCGSTDSGSTWTLYGTDDLLFEVWGNDAIAEITITSNYTGSGYIEVDGSPQTTPYTDTFPVGQVILLEALSPRVIYADVERKVYTSWSDAGNQIHNYTVPMGGATVTANYHTEYRHVITSTPITGDGILYVDGANRTAPYLTGWLDSGSSIDLYAYLFPDGNVGYAFENWNNYLARNQTVTPSTSANYTATYAETPFYGYATVNIVGNATVTLDGSPLTLPDSFNAIAGEEYTIEANGEGGGGGPVIEAGLGFGLLIVFAIVFALIFSQRDKL